MRKSVGEKLAMDVASWRHSDPASCTAKSLALFGLLVGLVVYWALAFVAWQPEGRGRRAWKAQIAQKARNALQQRHREREGGRERETTRMSPSPEVVWTPAMPRASPAPDVRSDLARRKPSLGRRSLEAEPHAEPRRSRRDTVVPPDRSDVQRAQRLHPEPYPSAESASAQSPATSARGERGDTGHRAAVKEHPVGARRLRVRHEAVPNTAGQADVTKEGEPAHTSPHNRLFQTPASLRRHKSAPVPQSMAEASRAFAPTPSGRVAVHDPFDPRLRLMPGDDDNEVAFTAHRLHRDWHTDWHTDGRHNRSAPSVFLFPGSKERASEVYCAQGIRCWPPRRLSKGAAHIQTLPRSASFSSARMMLPVVPDWHLWFQDVLRRTTQARVRAVVRATRAKTRPPCEMQGKKENSSDVDSEVSGASTSRKSRKNQGS